MAKSHMKMWVNLFCLLLLGLNLLCSAARPLVESIDLYIAPYDSKAEVACEEAAELKPWRASGNATKKKANNVELRFKESRSGGDAEQESPRLKVQRLSASEPSPGAGHIKVSRVAKWGLRGAVSRMHEGRVLESSPTPGGGH